MAKRRKPIRPISQKRRDFLAEFAEASRLVLQRSNGFCEVKDCWRAGTHIHHKKGRRCDDANSLVNLLMVDETCHARIHANPSWAYEQGYMLRRNG
jgi:hypothetical protein